MSVRQYTYRRLAYSVLASQLTTLPLASLRNTTPSLTGKYVGAEDQGNGIWRVYYRNVFLGYFNENKIRDKQVSIRLSQNLV